MKKIVLSLILILTFSTSEAQIFNFSSNRIYFVKSFISETQFKDVWLQGGSQWRLNRPAVFVNFSEIFIVLDETSPKAIAFVNKLPYNITYVSGDYFYESGYLSKVINKYKDGSRVMLEDYTEWDVVNNDDFEWVVDWFVPTNVIQTLDKEYLYDPSLQIKIKVKYAGKVDK